MKIKTLASCTSLESVHKKVCDYFYSHIRLEPSQFSPDIFYLFNKNGMIQYFQVEKVKDRYKFVELIY
jgi:hypothetical protein